MLEDPNKPDTLEATAKDYLGQPSPLAFKNQPALPSGGGSIGVGSGPATTAGGIGAGSVKRSADFASFIDSLGLQDPSTQGGGSGDGGTGGGPSPTGATEGNVTGFNSGLVGTGLTAASLAAMAPGALGIFGLSTGVPALSNALSLGKVANSAIDGKSDLATPSGTPVAALRTGLLDTIAAFMAAPLSDGRTVSDTISPVDNALSPGVAMNPGTFGATNMPGQTSFAYSGSPTGGVGPNMAQGGTGAPSNSGYGGYSGQSGDPTAPGAINFGFNAGQNRGDEGNGPGGGSGDKVICTAMNAAYGFGTFRNAVWLAYAREHLTPAHQRGYHRLALPMIRYAYHGRSWPRRVMRACMEHVVRHRSVDLWLTMRGRRRDPLGRVYRAALEPLCRVLGA